MYYRTRKIELIISQLQTEMQVEMGIVCQNDVSKTSCQNTNQTTNAHFESSNRKRGSNLC
jgi:hypothetical protein